MKKCSLLAAAVCVLLCASCSPGEPIPHQSYEDLDFEGPNISDLLFDYFADYYTDTYAIADGKVEIRAEYEFFSSWGCISYYLAIEQSVSESVKDATFQNLTDNPQHFADLTESYFEDRYDWLEMKIRYLKFTRIDNLQETAQP